MLWESALIEPCLGGRLRITFGTRVGRLWEGSLQALQQQPAGAQKESIFSDEGRTELSGTTIGVIKGWTFSFVELTMLCGISGTTIREVSLVVDGVHGRATVVILYRTSGRFIGGKLARHIRLRIEERFVLERVTKQMAGLAMPWRRP
jgi:hypothetical protein